MKRRGVFAVELLVALPLAALATAGAWFTFHTGARQGAAITATTDLLVAQVRVRAQLEADLGSLVTDGAHAPCTLSSDERTLELRTLAGVPSDRAARLPVRLVKWELTRVRTSGWNVERDGRVLSPRPLHAAAFSVVRRERTLTVRLHMTDAAGRAIDVASLHQAPFTLPGLYEMMADTSAR